MNPPTSFYSNTVDGSVKFNCNIDYQSSKDYPHFITTFCKFVNIFPQGSLIIDLKFIDNIDKKIIKDYGWAVVPLYSETGELNTGDLQIPLYKPPVLVDIVKAITGQPD